MNDEEALVERDLIHGDNFSWYCKDQEGEYYLFIIKL